MKIIATICARGGSKRIPKKNIKELAGKPLIAYTIETALQSKIFDRVIVSTEDEEIAEIAKKFGAEIPFMRPKELAEGKISRWTVFKHVVETLEKTENYFPDILIDLSPTCPLRKVEDIKECLKKLIDENADLVISVCESDRNPYFNMVELKNGKVSLVKKTKKQITQGQDAPKVYGMNDSIYAMRRNALKESLFLNENIKLVVMPKERSVDIDEEFDFKIAEFLIKNHNMENER